MITKTNITLCDSYVKKIKLFRTKQKYFIIFLLFNTFVVIICCNNFSQNIPTHLVSENKKRFMCDINEPCLYYVYFIYLYLHDTIHIQSLHLPVWCFYTHTYGTPTYLYKDTF